jgi:hypothetical protein
MGRGLRGIFNKGLWEAEAPYSVSGGYQEPAVASGPDTMQEYFPTD